ncbi:MinD/ParA family protein [Nocardia colli]|uniref:MinD/ParA family protein n=1 Tax=Nocardia colli TaxID=2545717 RepID=A0A5N0DXQ4_9NOCA|nr:MinD/ParA family protein [Nocardia colli]KAA8881917.1 MinD/ParA family protein [Nocardia colli]
MERTPLVNGRPPDTGRSGYDAYFADQAEPAAAAETPSTSPSPSAESPDYFRLTDAEVTVIGSPPEAPQRPAAPQPPEPAIRPETVLPPQTPPQANSQQPYVAARAADVRPPQFEQQAGYSEQPAGYYEQTGYDANAVIATRNGAWGPAPADHQAAVPDRYRPADQGPVPRIEVLPATLNSMDLLADLAATRRVQLRSTTGVRGALNKVGFNLGLSPAEQRAEQRRARIRRQLTTTYQIAVLSVKGGVGRTTTAAALGSTFAELRPDRVAAIDANPDFGDLATRTCRHPYGLTLRDLARSSDVDAFSAVQSYASINDSDLAVLASPWTTESNEALSGGEYMAAAEILRRHYNLLLVDCGTGVLDSVTGTVLRTSDSVLIVTPATVGGVTGAVATLNWLNAHGLYHLAARSIIAIVHQRPDKPLVEVETIENLFATVQRPTCVVPYDPHLAEGGEIDLRLLDSATGLAFEDIAAELSDAFPSYLLGAEGSADRGGWR